MPGLYILARKYYPVWKSCCCVFKQRWFHGTAAIKASKQKGLWMERTQLLIPSPRHLGPAEVLPRFQIKKFHQCMISPGKTKGGSPNRPLCLTAPSGCPPANTPLFLGLITVAKPQWQQLSQKGICYSCPLWHKELQRVETYNVLWDFFVWLLYQNSLDA